MVPFCTRYASQKYALRMYGLPDFTLFRYGTFVTFEEYKDYTKTILIVRYGTVSNTKLYAIVSYRTVRFTHVWTAVPYSIRNPSRTDLVAVKAIEL